MNIYHGLYISMLRMKDDGLGDKEKSSALTIKWKTLDELTNTIHKDEEKFRRKGYHYLRKTIMKKR